MSPTLQIDYISEHRLAICRPQGRLDAAMAERLLIYVLALEEAQIDPFDRLLDLRLLRAIRLSGTDVYAIARARRVATAGRPPVRTAMLAVTPFAYGIARLYEDLLCGSSIQVGVFRDSASAAGWLKAPLALVENQNIS